MLQLHRLYYLYTSGYFLLYKYNKYKHGKLRVNAGFVALPMWNIWSNFTFDISFILQYLIGLIHKSKKPNNVYLHCLARLYFNPCN